MFLRYQAGYSGLPITVCLNGCVVSINCLENLKKHKLIHKVAIGGIPMLCMSLKTLVVEDHQRKIPQTREEIKEKLQPLQAHYAAVMQLMSPSHLVVYLE